MFNPSSGPGETFLRNTVTVAVSAEHRRKWKQQAAALKACEQAEDAEITGAARSAQVAVVNARRRADGRPEVVNDEDEFPELGFHRLAVARGLVTRDR